MFSVCLTFKNENIKCLLEEIKRQISPKDEIIIIKAEKNKCNRSQGRNMAFRQAHHELLLFIDAGVIPDKNWYKEITSCMENSPTKSIIAGNYASVLDSFQKYLFKRFLNRDINSHDFVYPSARNFAIRKADYQDVGGFEENLNTAEDTEFFTRAVSLGYKIIKCEKSCVQWKLPDFKEYLFKIFSYAKGDAQTRIWWDKNKKWQTHNIKHIFLIGRYAFFAILLYNHQEIITIFLFIIYLIGSAVKNRVKFNLYANNLFLVIKNIACFLIIKISTDIMVGSGFILGILKSSIDSPARFWRKSLEQI